MIRRSTIPGPDFQKIFESLSGLYLILLPDTGFTIVAVTDSYARATLIDREKILGKKLFDIFPDNPDDPNATGVQNLKRSLLRVLNTKETDSMAVQKYDIQLPDGKGFEERFWSPINSPVFNEEGKLVYIIHRVEDVTDFVRLREQGKEQREKSEAEIFQRAHEIQESNQKLEKAHLELEKLYHRVTELDELKTQFFSNVSHELRTPLTLILGPVQQILAEKKIPPEFQKTLEVIERNSLTLLKQVNDLLDVAKLEAGKMEIHYNQSDFAKLVRFTYSHFESAFETKGVSFTVDTPATLPVQIDEEKIQRVMMNILSNAIKFVPRGGWVNCHAEIKDDHAILSIADNGPGIPKNMQGAVFERFRQVEGGATRTTGGTGLGLAIAKDFVELHHGRIDACETEGGGATFRIELPLLAPSNAEVKSSALEMQKKDFNLRGLLSEMNTTINVVHNRTDHVKSDAHHPTVLVVEDNPDMRDFIVSTLAGNFRVVTAENGAEGFERAKEIHPDLVLTDLMMPVKSGAELIVDIRNNEELRTIPIILLTAKADEKLKIQLLGDGCQDYLLKPFSQKELVIRVKNWVMVKRAKDLLAREVDSQSEDLISLTRELALKSRSLHDAKEKAERASQAKGQFLSLISHELNTPLTTLLLTLEMVGKNGVKIGNEKQFQRLLDASQKLRELIEMLLDYVRTENGRMIVQMTDVNISNLAHEIVDELRPQTVPKHITLEEEIKDIEEQTIKTDPRLLKIILSNLISNAIKYTKQGRVKLSLRSLRDKLLINVSDTGIGIAQENLAKIFEPFEQLRTNEGGRSTQGIGLGLTLVKEMVSALGGEIKVDSVPGKGSSFSVSLPI